MKQSKPLPKGAKIAIALVAVITVIAIIAVLTPDSGNADQREPSTDTYGQAISTTTTQTPTQAPAEDTIAVNQTITVNGLSFTATEIRRHSGTTFTKPTEADKVFIGVKFTVKNTSAENKSVAYLAPIFDSYADSTKCLLAPMGQTLFGTALNGDLAPDMNMEGYHVIEAPSNAKTLTLEFGVLYRDSANNKFVFEIPQG